MSNTIVILPFWLMGAPLLYALYDKMRTPRVADHQHSSLAGR